MAESGRKRGRPQNDKAKLGKRTTIPDDFMQLERDRDDPFGPFEEARYEHPESQCWKFGMQPHFNFENIRNFTNQGLKLPPYFTGNFSWDKEEQPVNDKMDMPARARRKQEWLPAHVPGAKVFVILKSEGISYNQLASYCHYVTPMACAEWLHTDGK